MAKVELRMMERIRNGAWSQLGWRRQFAQEAGLPFSQVLSANLVEQAVSQLGGRRRHRIFTPLVTLWVWLSPAQFHQLPETLPMRLIRIWVDIAGFRSRQIIVATTLLDRRQYPAAAIAAFCRARWHAELDLRSRKVGLGMEPLHIHGHLPGKPACGARSNSSGAWCRCGASRRR